MYATCLLHVQMLKYGRVEFNLILDGNHLLAQRFKIQLVHMQRGIDRDVCMSVTVPCGSEAEDHKKLTSTKNTEERRIKLYSTVMLTSLVSVI